MKSEPRMTDGGLGIWRPSEPFVTDLAGRERECVELKCPYSGCRASFIVHAKHWSRDTGQLTRPCPYCFRTSYLPNASELAHARGLEVTL
jgi:hypothetical protein